MRWLAIFLVVFVSYYSNAQESKHWLEYSDTLSKKRLWITGGSAVAVSAGSLIALNELWYKDYPKSNFHSFNDIHEWQGVDKVGHGFSSYYAGVVGYHSLRWSGVEEKKAIAFGATWGLAYLTAIEVLDGFNAQWGFSWGDMAANALGSGLFISQQLVWGEQRIIPKFSFYPSEFAQYRPNLLGKDFTQQVMKDYNGQTYWLSANVHSFLNEDSHFPKWLSVSVGYGATGMITGEDNQVLDALGNPLPNFDRYSQFYFSLDVDLHRLKTKSRFLNGVLTGLGWIKIPFPTLEFNKNGVIFHPIYF